MSRYLRRAKVQQRNVARMQTYLKTRPVGAQFFIFLFLVLSGLFVFVMMIGTALALKLAGLSLFEISDLKNWDSADGRYMVFLRTMLAVQFLGLFLIPALVFAYLSDPKPLHYLGLRKAPVFFFVAGVALLVAALPLVEYLGLLNRKINFPDSIEGWMKATEKDAQQQIGLLLKGSSPADLILNIIMVAGFAGVGEELFFRGVLQRLAIWGFKNVWVGIVVTAVLFSAVHFQFYGFFPRLLLGIFLGAIYWYGGSLWPAIAAHFFYDALLITLAYFNPEMISDDQANIIPASSIAIMAAASAIVSGALLWYMRQKSTADKKRFDAERWPNEPQTFTFDQ